MVVAGLNEHHDPIASSGGEILNVVTPNLLGLVAAAALVLSACAPSTTTSQDGEPDSATRACPVNDGGATALGMFGTLNGQFAPIAAIAADEDGAYVVVDAEDDTGNTTTTVFGMPPCGGPRTVLGSRMSPTRTGGTFAALAASHRVFVTMGDGIYSVSTTGGAMATETASTALAFAPVTVHDNQLYWIDGSATLWAVTIGGSNAAHVVARSPAPTRWTSVAADGSNAYVTAVPLSADGGMNDEADGSVLSIALSDGSISTLASGVYGPGNIIVTGASLYWTSNMYVLSVDNVDGTGSIEMLPLGGGPLTDVVRSEMPPPGPIMVVGTTVYWIDAQGEAGDALRTLPAGGTATTIPTPSNESVVLVLANSGAYWYSPSDYSFGRIAL
jgi:hypothetical protein